MANVTKSKMDREASSHSRGIMYHSRMRFLKSREGGSRLEGIVKRKSFNSDKENPSSKSRSVVPSNTPCSPESLLPPTELMTRPQAFRYACWKHQNETIIPASRAIRKMSCLMKKHDPEVQKKRLEIFDRIQAAESLSQRKKRERDAHVRADQIENTALSMLTKLDKKESSVSDKKTRKTMIGTNVMTTFSFEKAANIVVTSPTTGSVSSKANIDVNDSNYPKPFMFLEEWAKEKQIKRRGK